jgi:hypothetical protein
MTHMQLTTDLIPPLAPLPPTSHQVQMIIIENHQEKMIMIGMTKSQKKTTITIATTTNHQYEPQEMIMIMIMIMIGMTNSQKKTMVTEATTEG